MLQCLKNSQRCEGHSMETKWALKRILGRKYRSQKQTINCKLKTLLRFLELRITSICSSNCSIKRDLAEWIIISDSKCSNSSNSSRKQYRLMLRRKRTRHHLGSSAADLLPVQSNLTVCSTKHNRQIALQHKLRKIRCRLRLKPSQHPSTKQLKLRRSRQEIIKWIYKSSRRCLIWMTCKAKLSTLHQHQDLRCLWLRPRTSARAQLLSARMAGERTTHTLNRRCRIPLPASNRHVSPYCHPWLKTRSFRRLIKALASPTWRV